MADMDASMTGVLLAVVFAPIRAVPLTVGEFVGRNAELGEIMHITT
jgi:hypothetical protein